MIPGGRSVSSFEWVVVEGSALARGVLLNAGRKRGMVDDDGDDDERKCIGNHAYLYLRITAMPAIW